MVKMRLKTLMANQYKWESSKVLIKRVSTQFILNLKAINLQKFQSSMVFELLRWMKLISSQTFKNIIKLGKMLEFSEKVKITFCILQNKWKIKNLDFAEFLMLKVLTWEFKLEIKNSKIATLPISLISSLLILWVNSRLVSTQSVD